MNLSLKILAILAISTLTGGVFASNEGPIDATVYRIDRNVDALDKKLDDLIKKLSDQRPAGNYNRVVEAKVDADCFTRLAKTVAYSVTADELISIVGQCRETVSTQYCYVTGSSSNEGCFTSARALTTNSLTALGVIRLEEACKTIKYRCLGDS